MNSKLPKISVVIITYVHQEYILQTIKGVLMQEYNGEIEFIIANDNSPDETHTIVTNFFNDVCILLQLSILFVPVYCQNFQIFMQNRTHRVIVKKCLMQIVIFPEKLSS